MGHNTYLHRYESLFEGLEIQESPVKTDPCESGSTTLPVITVLQPSGRNISKAEITIFARLYNKKSVMLIGKN
jgi:hypothetical protein